MSPAGEVVAIVTGPLWILGVFSIYETSALVGTWIEREQRRRDILAGVEPPKEVPDGE